MIICWCLLGVVTVIITPQPLVKCCFLRYQCLIRCTDHQEHSSNACAHALLTTQPRTTKHSPQHLRIIVHFPTEEDLFSRHNFGWIGTRAAQQPWKKSRVDLWLVPGSSNHRRLFSFLWRRKNFKKEKGSRMEWEVIHRVALQPHIICILMIACFTSPQILLQNASRFIYILVNHSVSHR